jgi:hypothetical protein
MKVGPAIIGELFSHIGGTMHRVRAAASLVVVFALSACAASPGAQSTPSVRPTAETDVLYQPPSNPCDAVSSATRKKYKLTQPEDSAIPFTGEATDDGVVVFADTVRCAWGVDNPAKGRNGRPNQFSLTLDFQVPTTDDIDVVDEVARSASTRDVTPAQIAQTLLDGARADLEDGSTGTTATLKRTEPVNDLGDNAYSAVLTEKGDFGRSTMVVVAFRAANAHVKVTYSGADLQIDPSLPEGLQLVTTPVPPRRLEPVANAVARDALEALG